MKIKFNSFILRPLIVALNFSLPFVAFSQEDPGMRIRSTFHTLVVLTAVLTFSMSFGTLAQQNPRSVEAKIAAERDAEADVSKPLWFGTGCLLLGVSGGCVGVLALEPPLVEVMLPSVWTAGIAGSYFYRPDPPADRLLGKSPEYVAFYTDAYKAKRGQLHATWTTIGCASGSLAVSAVALAAVIAWAFSDWPP